MLHLRSTSLDYLEQRYEEIWKTIEQKPVGCRIDMTHENSSDSGSNGHK
jgi:hypothetical protein